MSYYSDKVCVSVIIPNYNHQNFIEQRIESVLNQTFQDFEIILLDDSSNDGSVEILKRYASHPKVSHLEINSINSGSPFKQWQKGIALAKGKFIWIAESDDYCESDFIKKLIPMFTADTILVYCSSKIVDSNGEIIGLDPWAAGIRNKRWLRDFRARGKSEIELFLRYKNTIPNASAVIFKKEIAEKVFIPVNMFFCGDWFFWIKLLEEGDLAYLSEPLNYFRTHDSTTRTGKSASLEKRRLQEYFKVISLRSTIFSRIRDRRKYDWLLNQCWANKGVLGSRNIFFSGMPLDLILRFFRMKITRSLFLK